MTSEELIRFNIKKKWNKARIEFFKEQLENVNKLGSTISDMPKGNRQIYDPEAESVANLVDKIRELIKEIDNSTVEMEQKIKMQLEKLKPKYGLLLYNFYVLDYDMKYIAENVLHYREKYLYDLRKAALKEFNKVQEKKG